MQVRGDTSRIYALGGSFIFQVSSDLMKSWQLGMKLSEPLFLLFSN